jgi:hypothetical protein
MCVCVCSENFDVLHLAKTTGAMRQTHCCIFVRVYTYFMYRCHSTCDTLGFFTSFLLPVGGGVCVCVLVQARTYLHVASDAEKKTKMNAHGSDICACLAADPENAQVALSVKIANLQTSQR